jgi:AraC-like DNA-binding protein
VNSGELHETDANDRNQMYSNGFSNVKSFIESFKKVYKSTPAKYKKKLDV